MEMLASFPAPFQHGFGDPLLPLDLELVTLLVKAYPAVFSTDGAPLGPVVVFVLLEAGLVTNSPEATVVARVLSQLPDVKKWFEAHLAAIAVQDLRAAQVGVFLWPYHRYVGFLSSSGVGLDDLVHSWIELCDCQRLMQKAAAPDFRAWRCRLRRCAIEHTLLLMFHRDPDAGSASFGRGQDRRSHGCTPEAPDLLDEVSAALRGGEAQKKRTGANSEGGSEIPIL
jgi:hypothetical protein